MGLFDSLFGTSTTNGQQQQTTAANNLLASNQAANAGILNSTSQNASNALNQGGIAGENVLSSGYGNAVTSLQNYGQQAQSGINRAAAMDTSGNGQYSPYVASGQGANTMLGNSLGLNGAAGNAAATAAFQANPGYGFQQSQAVDAAQRAAAAQGSLGGGGVLDAITRLSSNLANNEYSNWQQNLSGLGTQGLSAANAVTQANTAAGGALTTGAGLSNATGAALGNAYGNYSNQAANLYNQQAFGQANLSTGLGTSLANNNTNATNLMAQNDLKLGQAQDSATNMNNSTLSKIFGGAAGLGVSALGLGTGTGSGGGGGIFDSLLNRFSDYQDNQGYY